MIVFSPVITVGDDASPPDRSAAIRGFESAAGTAFVGIPTDWSTRQVVFSTPGDAATLKRVQGEPRYWLSLLRRSQTGDIDAKTSLENRSADFAYTGESVARRRARSRLRRDWSSALNIPSLPPAYPAKFSFNSTAGACTGAASDYVVYTLASNNAGEFNLIGFENLYVNSSGTGACAGTSTTPKFVYNASREAKQPLGGAPVISLNGTAIAFVENQTNGTQQAIFHVLLWHEGDVPTTTQPFPQPFNSSGPLENCADNGAVAPCQYSLIYSTGSTASSSSPYVDYGSDTAYVTDDGGHVLAIAPVFTATPAKRPAIVSGWGTATAPTVTTTGGNQLTPPDFDPVSQNVFVADVKGTLFYVRTNSGSSGSCASGSPPCLGASSLSVGNVSGSVTDAVLEPPLIDLVSEKLYVFSGGVPAGKTSGSYIVQTNPTISSSVFAQMGVGTGTGGAVVRDGAFNNAYLQSSNGTGLIYGCGYNANNFPILTAFPVSAGTLATTASGSLSLATAAAACSPTTENFQNNSTDLLFVGVQNSCVSGEADGCALSYNITSGFPSSSTPTAHTPAAGGTTGMIIDNATDTGGKITTNLYFSTKANQTCNDYFGNPQSGGPCAISLTQAGLH